MQYGKRERTEIGARLRLARETAGVSLEEAAEAVDVEPLAVAKWEKGRALPCLVQFRALLGLYGIMACQILFDSNPLELTRDEAAEITKAARDLTPGLQAKMSVILTLMSRGAELPVAP